MIRPFNTQDMDTILDIWLSASLIAHNFIDADFWKSKTDDMRNIYIPSSETYVFEEQSFVKGFLSLYENRIAAIFVSPSAQGRGIGKQLINYAKNLRNKLELEVYCQNKDSIGFYLSCGFVEKGETIDKNTNNPALFMEYIHT
ncbi:N-acetyltransferase [Photorhabdus temperata]|uniref:Acetyltransferase n=1 Tax=Photorhabdus temperata subsp. temperata Meg1 TaxID=1393735 RepID=A0A081RXR9_PHOTE|nr:N-acetyltransferase [Photorhabdus temperata]KER03472.1 acetyltransferase [Photorhabdus temperata subsp. temperata Meg1]MCT8349017.1 N-acetyltransferase [Photorhabdus temperata]